MIVHVAAAGEDRGRVVLKLTSGSPSPHAIEAALRVAQAFGSEIESLFVEDRQLFDLARLPLARQVSFCGTRVEAMSPELLARQMRHLAQDVMRRVGAAARAAEVPWRASIVRDEPVHAIARACTECGPWNVVALADALTGRNRALISQLFASVHDTTGVVVVGPVARRVRGPVIVVLEETAQLEPMLKAAERLATVAEGSSISLVVVGADETDALDMEGQIRLALGEAVAPAILRAVPRHGSPAEVAEVICRLHGSFVLAHFGGFLAPEDGDLKHLTGMLECPLLLLR